MTRILSAALGIFLIGLGGAQVPAAEFEVHPAAGSSEERLLLDALTAVQGQRLDDALSRIETLVRQQPDFRLAQLVYGDLLLAKVMPIETVGNIGSAADRERLGDLRDEARRRYHHHLSRSRKGLLPGSLLQLSAEQRHVMVVDIQESRLYLFENQDGLPVLVADFYAAAGKNGALKRREGDRKTPVGVYFISGHIHADELPDLYGAGALPINYPNAWDRRQGHTGYGIWLHGVPADTYSRAPRSSDGCVTLANEDFARLSKLADVGRTPVVISERIHWSAAQDLESLRAELASAVQIWELDWESRDPWRYARNYSTDFASERGDYELWVTRKGRINGSKSYIDVRISGLSLFSDPSEPRLAVATFQQDYVSDNYQNQVRKRQYWFREDDGVWRILYEASL